MDQPPTSEEFPRLASRGMECRTDDQRARKGPPTPADAAAWDDHFDVKSRFGRVLVPKGDIRNKASYDLIPGFQFIDRNLVLRKDASGHRPIHGYDELFGAIQSLL